MRQRPADCRVQVHPQSSLIPRQTEMRSCLPVAYIQRCSGSQHHCVQLWAQATRTSMRILPHTHTLLTKTHQQLLTPSYHIFFRCPPYTFSSLHSTYPHYLSLSLSITKPSCSICSMGSAFFFLPCRVNQHMFI